MQDVPPELRCHRHDFIEALPALHAHAVTLVTAATLEERQLTDLRMQSDALQNRAASRRAFADPMAQRSVGDPRPTRVGSRPAFGPAEAPVGRVIFLLPPRQE